MLEKLFQRVTERKQTWHNNATQDILQLAVLTGESELGNEVEIADDFLSEVADEIERRGLTNADFRHLVETYKKRKSWAQQLAEQPELRRKRDAAVAARDLHLKEHERIIAESFRKLESLNLAADAACAALNQTEGAHGNLLSTAAVTPEMQELLVEQQKLLREIQKLREKLYPGDREGDHPVDGALWGNLQASPGRLARQTREALANKKAAYTDERNAELQRQLKRAEAVVAECERELSALQRQCDGVNARLPKLEQAKLLPENLKLVRANTSYDERMKQHARDLHLSGPTHWTGANGRTP